MGRRSYESVPGLLRLLDIGLVPFLIDDFTRAINPLKIYEYLATGLPVVATALPELERFRGLIQMTGNSAPDFESAIATTLAMDKKTMRVQLVRAAQEYSWPNIMLSHVIPAIESVFGL
jgi:glycosyltransferase involved in cell wall biosynthesis